MDSLQKEFIVYNIEVINNANFKLELLPDGIKLFGSVTNLKNLLKSNFVERLDHELGFAEHLLKNFEELKYAKTAISAIANSNLIAKGDLESFYNQRLLRSIAGNVSKEEYTEIVLELFKTKIANDPKFKFIRRSASSIIGKYFDFIFSNGFPSNLLHINAGVMTANAGDSAQFLFLARAILAGYNCSNVDVRSSRYDAVIDFNGVLLRIQVKGISSGNSIKFKDRDRGGQGIDHTHARNKGQRITSADCDIYVAVDRHVGICYIIPMEYVDMQDESLIASINLSSLEHFKENWGIIAQVANQKKK